MSIKIVILGNGISAQLFMSYLKYHINANYSCLVLEKNVNIKGNGIDDVPFYFNSVIDDFSNLFVPITVEMGIYNKGNIIYQGNKNLTDKYAMKVLGIHSSNTIKFVEKKKRAYIIKNSDGNVGRKMIFYSELQKLNSKHKYLFGTEVVGVDVSDQILHLSSGDKMNYDFLISTISLKTLNSIARQWHFVDSILNLYPFFINRVQVVADNKYRVLYCLDDEIRFSRIAKLNDTIFLETRSEVDLAHTTLEEQKFMNLLFDPAHILSKSHYVYPGRFKQINEDVFIRIKEKYRRANIFLLGRMATWRFKLVEDIYEDCKEICECIF
jgi:hypothetical protein